MPWVNVKTRNLGKHGYDDADADDDDKNSDVDINNDKDFDSPTPRALDGPWSLVLVAAIIFYIFFPLPTVYMVHETLQPHIQRERIRNNQQIPSNWPIFIKVTLGFGMLLVPWILYYMLVMALDNCKTQDPW